MSICAWLCRAAPCKRCMLAVTSKAHASPGRPLSTSGWARVVRKGWRSCGKQVRCPCLRLFLTLEDPWRRHVIRIQASADAPSCWILRLSTSTQYNIRYGVSAQRWGVQRGETSSCALWNLRSSKSEGTPTSVCNGDGPYVKAFSKPFGL